AAIRITPLPFTIVLPDVSGRQMVVGPSGLLTSSNTLQPGGSVFTYSQIDLSLGTAWSRIRTLRQKGIATILVFAGGSHKASNPGRFLSIIDGVLKFDMTKYTSYL